MHIQAATSPQCSLIPLPSRILWIQHSSFWPLRNELSYYSVQLIKHIPVH